MSYCKACENLGCAMRGTDWTPNPAIKCFGWMAQTNADRIRSMTDDELAFLIGNGCPPKSVKPCREYLSVDGDTNCTDCWLDWLKSPVED